MFRNGLIRIIEPISFDDHFQGNSRVITSASGAVIYITHLYESLKELLRTTVVELSLYHRYTQ